MKRQPTKPALADQIDQLEERGSDLRFQVQHAGELLKLLAETMVEKHSGRGDPDYAPWRGAEYLADQIATHAAALGDMLEDLEKLGSSVGRASPAPHPPLGPGSRLNVVGGTDDAA
jgi:hypothetical protein